MMVLDRVPDRVRTTLDNWKFWVAMLIATSLCFLVWLAFVQARTLQTASKNAQLIATQQAASRASFNDCVRSIKPLHRISEHVSGVNDLASSDQELAVAMFGLSDILVENSVASINASTAGDPLQRTRRANLGRILNQRSDVALALEHVKAAKAKVAAAKRVQVPTRAQCKERFLRPPPRR